MKTFEKKDFFGESIFENNTWEYEGETRGFQEWPTKGGHACHARKREWVLKVPQIHPIGYP